MAAMVSQKAKAPFIKSKTSKTNDLPRENASAVHAAGDTGQDSARAQGPNAAAAQECAEGLSLH
jgi:hypothetical protein